MFWLTLATTGLTAFSLRPGVNTAADQAAAGLPVAAGEGLPAGPVVSLCTYVFMTAISLLKPWGMTRRGGRLRSPATSPKGVDGRSPRQTA